MLIRRGYCIKSSGCLNRRTRGISMKNDLFNPAPCVLVVDDHEISRQHTVEALLSVTNHVRQAACGLEAIECAPRLMPELIFTDIHLPDSCGLSLPHRIREAWPPEKPHPAFVFLTGDNSESVHQKAQQYDVCGILIKPASFCEIRNIALRLLKLEQGVQEYSTPQQAQVPRSGLRKLFLKELEIRLPQLDRNVSSECGSWSSQ
jgi:CheY-like chemotaxis protein